ncbi:MAG: hypothetical protein ACPHL6_06955 [Rubripirellula sp.]
MTVSNPTQTAGQSDIVTIDRRRADRRGVEASESQPASAAKKQRRRHIDPTTCERDYSGDEIEFMRAMDDYKRDSGRMFPTCSEVLEVIRSLGYLRLSDEQVDMLGLSFETESEEEHVDEVENEFESELADL